LLAENVIKVDILHPLEEHRFCFEAGSVMAAASVNVSLDDIDLSSLRVSPFDTDCYLQSD